MPITLNGYETKRFVDVVSEINADQIANLATDLNTSPETVLGVITNIFATSISSQEELNQAISDNFNIDKAEGKYLDDLVALVGISRLGDSPTRGTLEVTGGEGTVIPSSAVFSDGFYDLIPTVTTLTQNSCVKAIYSVSSVLVGFVYTLKIGSSPYLYIAQDGDVEEDIIASIVLQAKDDPLANVSYDSITGYMVVESQQQLSPIKSVSGSKFILESLVGTVLVSNSIDGVIEIEEGTVTSFTGVDGITSVTNPFDLTTGRLTETDEELRVRALNNTTVSGNATLPAIRAKLLQLDGVTSVEILENPNIERDLEGRPPYSYECVVTGGNSTSISETIFDSKPAGIRTYGDILGTIDYEGTLYSVYYSRPLPTYAWVNVEYTIYDEEIFPSNGEDLIKQVVTEYGDSLGNGVDIIPKRFYTSIYSNVAGVEDLTISIATKNILSVDPELNEYTESLIPIPQKQFANFNIDRVQVNQGVI